MLRYVSSLCALVITLALTGGTTFAASEVPSGPRLAVAVFGPGTELRDAIVTIGPSGQGLEVLISGPNYWGFGDRASWSADGSLLAFSAFGPFQGSRFGITTLSGGSTVFPRAFLNASDPVLSPAGRTAYFADAKLVKVLPGRESYLFKTSIWSLDLAKGTVRRKTKWQLGVPMVPSSLSPDGQSLAGTRHTRRGRQAVALNLRTGRLRILAQAASEPTYSPDGSRVAFVRWRIWRTSGSDNGSPPINELRVARVGAFPRSQLVLRKRKLLAWPSWDPSGNRLAFTLSHVVENGHESPELGDKLMAVNSDGTCLTRVFTDPDLILYGATWQPGPGREAGRIEC